MKRFWRFLLSRTFLITLLALLQIIACAALFSYFSRLAPGVYVALTIVAVLILVVLFEKDELNPAYKMMWILIVLIMPVSGAVVYLLLGKRHLAPKKVREFSQLSKRTAAAVHPQPGAAQSAILQDPSFAPSIDYLTVYGHAPIYSQTECEYYPLGEAFFPRFLAELEKAQHSIFMEYFIIDDESEMWRRTLEVLTRKAQAGVDVRILYDGYGCIVTLPGNYDAQLRAMGIQCRVFNAGHLSWHLTDYKMLNHRDHRKITVIDGEVGFSGGLNFADEYINRIKRFGVWKDTGFLLRGPAVYSLSLMFLQMWDYVSGTQSPYLAYLPRSTYASDGFVQPYGDSPLDDENVAESAYFNVLHRARRYVYIVTPYLVIDHEMLTCLCLAAKSGVDVRIITPGIPDKWYVYLVTQSYYPTLLRAGVRIFEYTPGFVHAKMYVSDDDLAIVGSANMDYRSLYLHFENCCSFYGGHMVMDVKQDVCKTLEESHEVTLRETEQTHFIKRIFQVLLRFFAPMM